MSDLVLNTPRALAGGIDLGQLLDWLASEPPAEQVAATREEALRIADYLQGKDKGARADMLRAARLVEWEMAHRWPAKPTTGRRGDDRPRLANASAKDKDAWQLVYGVGKQDRDWIAALTEPEQLSQAAVIAGPTAPPRVSANSGQVEWYTPPEYIEAARFVMGGIDTDPASSPFAQATVQATYYYTAEQDGLAQPWRGRVWLNPPYTNALMNAFIGRLVKHQDQWMTLTNNATETAWAQQLVGAADAVCLIAGRVRFICVTPEGQTQPGSPLQGQIVAYKGPNLDRFRDIFGPKGRILT